MNCEQIREQLTAFLLGDLPAATSAEIRGHLEKCDGCRAAAREIEPTLDLLRDALAATSAKAPAKLSREHRRKIRTQSMIRPAERGRIIKWLTTPHGSFSRFVEVAAVFMVLCVLAGMLMPAVAPARDRARRAKSMSNLSQIGKAIKMYSMDHAEQLPNSLDDLKTEGYAANEKLYVSPSSGETYQYSGQGLTESAPSDRPIAVERTKEGGNVLYLDGSVQWHDKKELEKEVLPKLSQKPAMIMGAEPASGPRGEAADASGDRTTDVGFKAKAPTLRGLLSSRERADSPATTPVTGAPSAPAEELTYADFDEKSASKPGIGAGGGGKLGSGTGGGLLAEMEVSSGRRQISGASSRPAKEQRKNAAEAKDSLDQVASATVVGYRTVTVPAPTRALEKGMVGTDDRIVRLDDKAKRVAEKPMAPPPAPADKEADSSIQMATKSFGVMPTMTVRISAARSEMPAGAAGGEFRALEASTIDHEEARKRDASAETEREVLSDAVSVTSAQELQGTIVKKLGKGQATGMIKWMPESRKYVITDAKGISIQIPLSDVEEVRAKDLPKTESAMKPAAEMPEQEELTGPRFKAAGVNPFIKTVEQAFSTFSIGVDTASYTLMRNYMQKGYLPPAESVRTEEFVNFFDYAYTAPTRETFRIYVDVAPSKFGHGLHLMKIGVKGRRLGREEQRQARLTFLIDTSGSMDKPDRIGLVKKSLRMLVEKMAPQDLVAILQYDSHARLVLEFTPVSDKKKILDAIDALQCSGSTNLEEGMMKAYELAAKNYVPGGESRVLLLSDGVANLGTMAAEDILKAVEAYRKQGIFCSVFGVGMGTYDDTMLQTLAAKGDGTYAFLDSEEEAKRVFVDDLSATLNTIAKDVKIQVEFSPWAVTMYRQLGYESRQLKKEDFRNDSVDAGEVGSGQSVTALYEMSLADVRIMKAEMKAIYPIDDRIATVRVRYRRMDNNEIEEIEQPVRWSEVGQSFDEADVRLRLAACAAEFAEILRGSPFADGSEFKDVADMLRPVALELNLDQQVQELLRLISSANGMSRAPAKE